MNRFTHQLALHTANPDYCNRNRISWLNNLTYVFAHYFKLSLSSLIFHLQQDMQYKGVSNLRQGFQQSNIQFPQNSGQLVLTVLPYQS